MIFSLGACESDDTIRRVKGNLELCQDIEPTRRIVAEFKKAEGTIVVHDWCPSLFILSGGPDHEERFAQYLWPCNLPEEFRQEDMQVEFSGYLYEVFETEDICAQIFELTSITRN